MPESRTTKKPNSAAAAPPAIGAATSAGSIGSPDLHHQQPRAIGAEPEIRRMSEARRCRHCPPGNSATRRRARRSAPRCRPSPHRRRPAAAPASPAGATAASSLPARIQAVRGRGCPPAAPRAPQPASGRPSSPQGFTTSTAAISRNTSTSVIFGKISTPKACNSPISSAARKAPGNAAHAADHRDDEGLGDDGQVHLRRWPRRAGSATRRPAPPARRRGTACR